MCRPQLLTHSLLIHMPLYHIRTPESLLRDTGMIDVEDFRQRIVTQYPTIAVRVASIPVRC